MKEPEGTCHDHLVRRAAVEDLRRGGHTLTDEFEFPRVRWDVIGALNVFGATVGTDFDDVDVPTVQSLADVAAIGLLQQRALVRVQTLTRQLQHALDSRVIIEQAKGVIIHAYGVGPNEAFALMRTHARRHQNRLADLARAIVTNPAAVADLKML